MDHRSRRQWDTGDPLPLRELDEWICEMVIEVPSITLGESLGEVSFVANGVDRGAVEVTWKWGPLSKTRAAILAHRVTIRPIRRLHVTGEDEAELYVRGVRSSGRDLVVDAVNGRIECTAGDGERITVAADVIGPTRFECVTHRFWGIASSRPKPRA